MTKNKFILILMAGALLCIGCNRDEESLFDTPAALRLDKTMTQAETILTNAENGWEMLYFPNPYSAGYSVLIKFFPNGQTIAASRNPQTTGNVYKTDKNSTWAIKADYGPILSFDTYNKVMHAWADPQTDGDGFLGDYEFLVLSSSKDCVRLKGKKHEAYVYMYPLDKSLDWETYFKQVYQQREYIVTGNDGTFLNYVEGENIFKTTVSTSSLVNATEVNDVYPFIVRPNGITFHGNGLGSNAVNFSINQDLTAYVCTDEGINGKIVPAYSLPEIFDQKLNSKKQWELNKSDMGSESATAYNTIKSALKKSGGTLRGIYLQRTIDGEKKKDIMQVEFNGTQGISQAFFEMTYILSNNTYTFSYINKIEDSQLLTTEFLMRAGGGNEATGVERIKELICGNYAVTSVSGCTLNARQLYFTDPANANKRLSFTAK